VTEYRAFNPHGKGMLKGAEYRPPHELPDEEYPLALVTGRTLYQFHTRTKTGRAPQLQAAAPDVWVEMSAADALALALTEGDLAEITTRRGSVQARVRVTAIRPGVVFLPFHYGYWDTADPSGPGEVGRAANELTPTEWDAVSKQPLFKSGAARVVKVSSGEGRSALAPTTTASAPLSGDVPATSGGDDAQVDEATPVGSAS